MPSHMVNLDALIRREDFTVNVDPKKTNALNQDTKMKIVELEVASLWFKWIRKPDFQRTTAQWSPEKVAGFIESYVAGDLIPALILWQSDSRTRRGNRPPPAHRRAGYADCGYWRHRTPESAHPRGRR